MVTNKLGIYIHFALALGFFLTFHRGGMAAGGALCLLGLLFSMGFIKNIDLQRNQKFYLITLVGFFISALCSFLLGRGWLLESVRHPGNISLIDLDLPSKYLLLAFFTWLFWKKDFLLSRKVIFTIIALTGYLNGIIALYQRFVLNVSRIHGLNGIIEFGDTCGILSIFLLVIFSFSKGIKVKFFYFGALFFVYLACIMTGTRGSILSVIFGAFLICILTIFYRRIFIKQVLIGCFALLLSFVFVSFFSPEQAKERAALIDSDLQAYQKGVVGTSIGLRFEMWKEGFAMWKMAPFFGLSTVEIKERFEEIMKKSGSRIERSNNYLDWIGRKHSQFFNALGKRGIVGLLAILFVWYGIAKLFSPYLKHRNDMVVCLALCILGMLGFSIVPNSFIGEIWESNVNIFVLGISVAIFFKLIWQEGKNTNGH